MTAPFGVFAYDDVIWLHQSDGIYLSLGDDVPAALLAPHAVNDLRAWL